MTTQIHAPRDVSGITPDSVPDLTVLGVLAAGWTWRTDPDDQQPPAANAGDQPGEMSDCQLIRALAWARVLIG